MLALLWFCFFLHQGDRQVFNALIPLMREGLALTDTQLGLVATIFTIAYGVLVPFAGYAGDVFQKRHVVMISLLTFSLGTLLTGFAGGIITLILFRSIATGTGESIYYPSANALIAQYHKKTRAQAMAVHQTALYVGIVGSGWLAGWIGQSFGWRYAFIVFGGTGLLWALLLFWRLRDDRADARTDAAVEPPAQGETADPGNHPVESDSPGKGPSVPEVLAYILRRPTVYFFWIGFGCMVFVNIGYTTWMPAYLFDKFGMSPAAAGFNSTFYHFLAAAAGIALGARVSDRLASRFQTIRLDMKWIGLITAFPFILMMARGDSLWVVYVGMALFGFFRGMYDSNLFAALFDVIEPRYRGTATGLMLGFAFVVGGTAPVILGWIKDTSGMENGMSLLAYVFAGGGVILLLSRLLTFKKDYIAEE
jgi:sugar phosphate permease